MLLSRFWYVVLALLLGGAIFVLYLATSMYNRAGARAMGEGLSSDSQVVGWYLRNDARKRSAQLINFALDREIAKHLNKSSNAEKRVPREAQDEVRSALRKINEKLPEEQVFDAVFAVDQHGRVVAHLGYEQASGMDDFELGGYPVVADALHGYIRDDTLVLDRIYRVVARPVEFNVNEMPAGAVIGARIVDDRFARELSDRTGAAVAFYANGQRVASGAPEGFDRGQLDQIVADLPSLDKDEAYQEKGRSKVREIDQLLGVQYSRLPGEAWELGAGYAVARLPSHVEGPLGFFDKADDKDKEQANITLAVLVALAGAALGLIFTLLEHTRPLRVFRGEATRLAQGKTDQLQPSKFRGVYRKIASDLNDGIDVVAAKGGAPRRAADLKQVLGDIPDQPQMSAFSFPGEGTPSQPRSAPLPSQPRSAPAQPGSAPAQPGSAPAQPPSGLGQPGASAPGSAQATVQPSEPGSAAAPSTSKTLPRPPGKPAPPRRPAPPGNPKPPAGPVAAAGSAPVASQPGQRPPASANPEEAEWREVYEKFVETKQQCGEDVDGFTYEKFEKTLQKNRNTLINRHGAKRVKFSVYVKDGKAALKANPLRE